MVRALNMGKAGFWGRDEKGTVWNTTEHTKSPWWFTQLSCKAVKRPAARIGSKVIEIEKPSISLSPTCIRLLMTTVQTLAHVDCLPLLLPSIKYYEIPVRCLPRSR